ncbi:MAG: FmdC precursor, partial [Proteobacteria bacterium]|nr:FmdC precursor [Pseudomonadota bacterium]
NFGNDYTAKLELLPFGEFSGKGDYFSSDLKREPLPKLAFGITYGYNDNAIRSRGQLGSVLSQTRDLETLFVDMMYKHNGVSVLAEYANKKVANGSPAILDTSGDLIESFYTGTAVNAQLGYLFKNNWEISGRFTQVNPQKVTLNNDLTQYTLGVSKYIVGHSLKVQSDFSLLQEDSKADRLQFRLQLELAF